MAAAIIYLTGMDKSKTVQEVYYLDESELENMARFSKTDYIDKSLKFYRSVKLKPVSQLSEKQVIWLNKLRDMMLDRERKRLKFNLQYQPKKRFTLWPKKVGDGWVWLFYYE